MAVRWLIGLAMVVLVLCPPASAAAAGCDTDVYLSIDYARTLVLYSAESLDKGCLAVFQTAQAASANVPWQATPQDPWSTYGQVAGGLASAGEASWTASFDLSLQPDQRVRLLLPFAAIDFANITPPPANMQALLATSTFALDGRIANDALEYDGAPDTPSTIHVVVPFTPVHKAVSLTLTPLFGRMLLGQTDSFRVSGNVQIDVQRGMHELVRHCQSPPGYSTDSYRSADVLFTLDNPPRSGFAMEPRLFLAKPSYLAIATDVVNCEASAGTGMVQTVFNGTVQHRPDLAALFPAGWLPATSVECNRAIGPQATTAPGPSSAAQVGCPTDAGAWPRSAYELALGEIALGPTDTLDIQMPGAEILGVRPIPDHADLGPTASPMLSYKGPARFALIVEYRPLATLVAQQAPSAGRALAQPLDVALSSALTVNAGGCTSPMAPQTLLVVAVAAIATWSLRRLNGPLAWIAAACLVAVLYFGVRGVFGLLAAILLLWAARSRRSAALHWAAAGVGLVLTGAGLRLDCLGVTASPTLPGNGPLTPVVLLPLGVLLLLGLSWSQKLQPGMSVFAVAVVLISIAAFDVLDKSLVVLLVLGLGLVWVAGGVARCPTDLSLTAATDRMKACVRRPVVPVGIVLLAVFTFENSLTNTVAYAEAFTQWTVWFQSLVLLVSIVMTFLALGALFLVVYPLLPSRIGYIKALAFGGYFLILFLVGVGADERLIITLPQLTIGRAMYYLAVPVLIGVYLDLTYRPTPAATPSGDEPAPASGAAAYLDRLRSRIGMVGAIVSILAPSIYAAVARSPVVASYFDLLNQLAKSA